MNLTVIGCSGSFPGPLSPASCYLVTANDGERTWRIGEPDGGPASPEVRGTAAQLAAYLAGRAQRMTRVARAPLDGIGGTIATVPTVIYEDHKIAGGTLRHFSDYALAWP